MNPTHSKDQAASPTLARGTVCDVDDDGVIFVESDAALGAPIPCDILELGAADSRRGLEIGDTVFVALLPPSQGRAVILGRLRTRDPEAGSAQEQANHPDELVLEAKEQLTLRVGDGSITIRADGKILIKGTDLVSHARRMNRIKGGAVAIN